MFRKNTTLILGAGASYDFGLPLGTDLKNQISKSLHLVVDDLGRSLQHGSSDIFNALVSCAQNDPNPSGQLSIYLSAANEISDAVTMCSSIDDCIERHAGNKAYELCAKLAIAQAILSAERKSRLRIDPRSDERLNMTPFNANWLAEFLQLATKGLHVRDLSRALHNIRFIVFNYDRCFEQFTHNWLKTVYRIEDPDAANIIKRLNIIHPYGSLGDIFHNAGSNYIPYGGEVSHGRLIQISQNLKTYSESIDIEQSKIVEAVENSQNIIFMGFGFHQQNLDLMKSKRLENVDRHIYASSVGISSARWDSIRNRLASALSTQTNHMFTHNGNKSCEDLLAEFADNLVD